MAKNVITTALQHYERHLEMAMRRSTLMINKHQYLRDERESAIATLKAHDSSNSTIPFLFKFLNYHRGQIERYQKIYREQEAELTQVQQSYPLNVALGNTQDLT